MEFLYFILWMILNFILRIIFIFYNKGYYYPPQNIQILNKVVFSLWIYVRQKAHGELRAYYFNSNAKTMLLIVNFVNLVYTIIKPKTNKTDLLHIIYLHKAYYPPHMNAINLCSNLQFVWTHLYCARKCLISEEFLMKITTRAYTLNRMYI